MSRCRLERKRTTSTVSTHGAVHGAAPTPHARGRAAIDRRVEDRRASIPQVDPAVAGELAVASEVMTPGAVGRAGPARAGTTPTGPAPAVGGRRRLWHSAEHDLLDVDADA